MKVDSRFHCFGCGADGDVIDFTAKLFQLSLWQAVEKLTADFGLIGTNSMRHPPLYSQPCKRLVDAKEQLYKTLCEYRSLLASWRTVYAPQNPTEELHPCFVTSLHYIDWVQYLLDVFLHGTAYERQQLLNGKEVTALGKALAHCKESTAA